jgi:hypothetical protein
VAWIVEGIEVSDGVSWMLVCGVREERWRRDCVMRLNCVNKVRGECVEIDMVNIVLGSADGMTETNLIAILMICCDVVMGGEEMRKLRGERGGCMRELWEWLVGLEEVGRQISLLQRRLCCCMLLKK